MIVGHIEPSTLVIFKARWVTGNGRAMETHVDLDLIRGRHYVFTLDWRNGDGVNAKLKDVEGDTIVDYGKVMGGKPISYAVGGLSDEWNPVLGDRDGMSLELMVREKEGKDNGGR